MSPRAAARLEALGFGPVYDYIDGKAGWAAAGLPLEGGKGNATRAGAHARTDVPTCRYGDQLADVRRRVAKAGWDTCFVVNEQGIILGRIGRRALAGDANMPVAEAMTEGPSTVRPSAPLALLVERMQRRGLSNLPVTTLDGRLVGLLLRGDAERALARAANE